MVEITNGDELKAWLETQEQRVCCAIAARAALRSLPAAMAEVDNEEGKYRGVDLTLACMRAVLISGVAGTWPTPEMSDLENAAASAISAAAAASAISAAAAASAISAAAADSAAAAASAISAAAADSVSAAYSARSAAYHDGTVLQSYASTTEIFVARLWPTQGEVQPLLDMWTDFQNRSDLDGIWSFWVEWYDGMLNGRPMDWELQRKIAVIEDDIWDAGPEAVAKEIEKIRAGFSAEGSDADTINPEAVAEEMATQLFEKAPIVQASMENLSEAISMRLDLFDRMARPNEVIPFIETYRQIPATADRIRDILRNGIETAGAEMALALEVGRLRAEVETLKSQLRAAHTEIEDLKQKPWYRKASVLLPTSVIGAVVTGLWTLSGDDKLLESRWNKLAVDLEFLQSEFWPEPDDRLDEPLQFELPEIDDV